MTAPESLRQRLGHLFADEDRLILMDYLLLLLAVASAIILFLEWNVDLTPDEEALLTLVDRVAIVLFALGFAGKVLAAPRPVHVVKTRWPELIGLMPLTQPFIVAARFYPIVQILAVLTRFSIGLDRHLGERALFRLFERYRAALVEELTDPILVRASIVTEAVLREGTYARSIGNNLEDRRPEIHTAVDKALAANPHLRRMLKLPGVPKVVDEAVDAAVDAAVASLVSDEMEEIVQSTIAEVMEDFRRNVRAKRWQERGVGLGDVAKGMRTGRRGGATRVE